MVMIISEFVGSKTIFLFPVILMLTFDSKVFAGRKFCGGNKAKTIVP